MEHSVAVGTDRHRILDCISDDLLNVIFIVSVNWLKVVYFNKSFSQIAVGVFKVK